MSIFKALADPNRLRILKTLQIRPLCVCELTDVFGLAASTVSQHLSILKESGFITEEKVGKWTNYKLNHKPKDDRISAILVSLDFWIGEDLGKKVDTGRIKKVDRAKICCR